MEIQKLVSPHSFCLFSLNNCLFKIKLKKNVIPDNLCKYGLPGQGARAQFKTFLGNITNPDYIRCKQFDIQEQLRKKMRAYKKCLLYN